MKSRNPTEQNCHVEMMVVLAIAFMSRSASALETIHGGICLLIFLCLQQRLEQVQEKPVNVIK